MADWRQASEHYLALHQIGQIWERITHSLVTLRPPDVMEHTIQKLEKLKTQKDVPGRRLVFLVGGPGSKAKEVAESYVAPIKKNKKTPQTPTPPPTFHPHPRALHPHAPAYRAVSPPTAGPSPSTVVL